MKRGGHITEAEGRGLIAFGILLVLVLGALGICDRLETRRMASSEEIEVTILPEATDTTAAKKPEVKKPKVRKVKKPAAPPAYRDDRLSDRND